MKDDCLLYSQKFKKCIGLTELLCKKGKCSFYKPKHKPEGGL